MFSRFKSVGCLARSGMFVHDGDQKVRMRMEKEKDEDREKERRDEDGNGSLWKDHHE